MCRKIETKGLSDPDFTASALGIGGSCDQGDICANTLCANIIHFWTQEVFLTFTCILVCCMFYTMFCLEGYPEAAAHPECSDTSSYEHAILYPHNTCSYECNSSSGRPGALSPIKPYEDFIQTLECLPVLYNS